MSYQTTIAISKFRAFISEGFLYAPPARFEPILFRTSYLQVARLQVHVTTPGIYPMYLCRERILCSTGLPIYQLEHQNLCQFPIIASETSFNSVS